MFFSSDQGSSLVETALVGIPVIFILLSTFEMGRGMWMYTTLAHAARETSRYASTHGQDCSLSGNSCSITVGTLASRFLSSAIGMSASNVNVTFTSLSDNISCAPLSTCSSSATTFPSTNGAGVGNPITVTATLTFHSALSFYWPGSKRIMFGAPTFKATSTDYIQF